MIVKTIDDKTLGQLKNWLKRKGYTNSVKMSNNTFVYLTSIVINKPCTWFDAKERLYAYIIKNDRLKESERANRIRESTNKKTGSVSKRNGYNERCYT